MFNEIELVQKLSALSKLEIFSVGEEVRVSFSDLVEIRHADGCNTVPCYGAGKNAHLALAELFNSVTGYKEGEAIGVSCERDGQFQDETKFFHYRGGQFIPVRQEMKTIPFYTAKPCA